MTATDLEPTLSDDATETQIVETAQVAVSRCNWLIGECATAWTVRYAKGRTDADFADLIGLSGDQVYQRRRVWETFADVRGEYGGLRWSHFYAAVTWDDASECLAWAEEMGATVAEMKAWRRASRGEDLSQPAEEETAPFETGLSPLSPTETSVRGDFGESSDAFGESSGGRTASEADMASTVARSTGDGSEPYAPFGKDARGEAPTTTEERDAPVRPLAALKKVAAALERLDKQLTPEVLAAADEVPDDVKQRLMEAMERVAAKVAEI